jgi:ribosomal protein S18 acetylase RimI-like enzyme
MATKTGADALLVRPAVPRDAPAIAGVHVRAWQHAYRGLVPDALLDALDLRKRTADWHRWLGDGTLVAERDGRVVAFFSLVPSRDVDAPPATGEIMAIYVSPEQTRRGAGRALLEACVAHARGRYRTLTLWVFTDNARARRFYEACGFVVDGSHKLVELGGARLDEVRYRRELPEP